MNDTVAPQDLALQRLYHWEKTTPDRKVFTQPMGAGVVREMSWREVVDETRRMASHLQSYGFPAGSRIAIEFELTDGRKLFGEFVVKKPEI